MKRFIASLVMTVLTTGMILTGCGGLGEKNSSAEEAMKNMEEAVKETEEAAEHLSEDEEKSEADNKEDKTADAVIEIPSKYAISKMLDEIIDWVGLQYMYDPTTDYESLTNDAAVEIAAFAYMRATEDLDFTELGVAIPKSAMDEKMQNLFGKTYNMETYTEKLRGYIKIGSGKLYITPGDWGLVAPVYTISNVDDHGDGEFHIYIKYYAMDYETNSEYGNYNYEMELVCKVDENSPYGFVIAGMKGRRTGTDPEAFDASTVEGTYKYEPGESVDAEADHHTRWIVINKDGKGYMYDREKTSVEILRFDIVTEAGDVMPYMVIDDELTLYISDDNTRVYTKTDEMPEM